MNNQKENQEIFEFCLESTIVEVECEDNSTFTEFKKSCKKIFSNRLQEEGLEYNQLSKHEIDKFNETIKDKWEDYIENKEEEDFDEEEYDYEN